MKKILYILFTFSFILSKNFIYSEDTWYSLTSPEEITSITYNRDKIYFSSENGLFVYDKAYQNFYYSDYLLNNIENKNISSLDLKNKSSSIIFVTVMIFIIGLSMLYFYDFSSLKEKNNINPRSIAVLPFDNFSPNPEDEYLSNGFTEVIIAPSISKDAERILSEKKNLRVMITGGIPDPLEENVSFKTVSGGFLTQSRDNISLDLNETKIVTKRKPTDSEVEDLIFAFIIP